MIVIDPRSPVPPFEQLRVQLLAQVQSGEPAPGARPPTVRRLADDLGIAPNTVARTYRELEASGIIETRGRNGSFVAPQGDATHQAAQRAAAAFAEQMRALRVGADEAIAMIQAALSAPAPNAPGSTPTPTKA